MLKGRRQLLIVDCLPAMKASFRPWKAGKDACFMLSWLSLLDCWS